MGRAGVAAVILLALLGLCLAAAPSVSSVAAQLHPPDCASDQSAATCPTAMAAQFRAKIAAELAQGESQQQIVAGFERQYGAAVLELPQGRGLGTLAWWLPPIALVIGAGIFSVFLAAWRRRTAAAPARANETPASDEVPPEVRERM